MDPVIPRGAPLDELAHVLAVSFDGLDAEAAADVVVAKLQELCPQYDRALLPIDQAEELLRGDFSFFFDVLSAILQKGRGRILMLATMRSDFLNEFQQSGLIGKGRFLEYETFTLDPLPDDRLVDIIEQPARLFQARFEPALIARIVQDHSGRDALPLLAFFLNEFWRKDYFADGVLQLSEYESFGGLSQALHKAVRDALEACRRCDASYADSDVLIRDLEELFLGHLVAISAVNGEAVRNRASLSSLSEKQHALLREFGKKRLLIEKEQTWEVVHEALFRQWPDLARWIDAAREDLVTIDRVRTAAAQWHEAGRLDADLSHEGNRLSEAFGLIRSPRYGARFAATDIAYLEGCEQKYRDQLAKEESLRKRAEQERQVAEEQSLRARTEARRAQRSQRFAMAALSKNELNAGRSGEALRLALAAWPRQQDAQEDVSDYQVVWDAISEARDALREVCRIELPTDADDHWVDQGFNNTASSIAFSPDGACLAAGCRDGTIRLYDVASGTLTGQLGLAANDDHKLGTFDSVAYSPCGAFLVSAGSGPENGGVWLWDMENSVRLLQLCRRDMRQVAFSPCGEYVAFGGWRSDVEIVRASNGEPIDRLPWSGGVFSDVYSLAFGLNGDSLAVAHENGALVWHRRMGAEDEVTELFRDRSCPSVAFNANGTVATASSPAILWSPYTGEEDAFQPPDAKTFAQALAFSADGRAMIWGDYEGTVGVYLPFEGELLTFRGHQGMINDVEVSPDGLLAASASEDGTLRLWRLSSGVQTVQLDEFTLREDRHLEADPLDLTFSDDGARLLRISPTKFVSWDATLGHMDELIDRTTKEESLCAITADGAFFISSLPNGELLLCRTVGGAVVSRLETGVTDIEQVCVSDGGARIVILAKSGALTIWDGAPGWQQRDLLEPGSRAQSISLTADGRYLTACRMGVVRFWDLETGQQETFKAQAGYYSAFAALSPDGARIAMTNGEALQVQDVASGKVYIEISMEWSASQNLVFSPDGTLLAMGQSNSVIVWDIASGHTLARFNNLPYAAQVKLAFAPDGRRLGITSALGAVFVFDVSIRREGYFNTLYARLPTATPPEIAHTYELDIGEAAPSGEEPWPIHALRDDLGDNLLIALPADLDKTDAQNDPFHPEYISVATLPEPPMPDPIGEPIAPPPLAGNGQTPPLYPLDDPFDDPFRDD